MRFPLIFTALLAAHSSQGETMVNGRPSLVLKNGVAQAVIDIAGGSFVDFHLLSQGLNPLTWNSGGEETAPRPMGHFLCLDRWGAPSAAEAERGMPFHGEASYVDWQVDSPPTEDEGEISAIMSAVLPMAGLSLKRWVRFAGDRPLLIVREELTNDNDLGRIYNMVQHPSIGPPFLDEGTLVDANARQGFMQASPLPNPEIPAVVWPQGLKDTGESVNMRHLTDDMHPNVVSYIIEEEYGWTTAANPAKGLLIGYIWPTADYPWFDAWRHVADGKPVARGLEFGTTGLHQPFDVLVEKGRIFDRLLFSYLDAGASTTRSFANFLFEIPADYRGVGKISLADGELVLSERGGGEQRSLRMTVGDLFAD